jgi:hypothetical protein
MLLNKCLWAIVLSASLIYPSSVKAAEPSLLFAPITLDAGLNYPFNVTVTVDTAGYSTGGVGAIINYDPFTLAATSIQTGSIFADYPMSSINNEKGKITISGIAASQDHLFSGTGVFATITFTPKQLGFSDISFAFNPGLTTDSNIAVNFGNGDILSKVNKVSVNIGPTSNAPTPTPAGLLSSLPSLSSLRTRVVAQLATLNLPFISNKYASAREGRPVSDNLDPLEPITGQAPITDPNATQPTASVNNIASSTPNYLVYSIVAILLFIILTLVSLLNYRKQDDRTQY